MSGVTYLAVKWGGYAGSDGPQESVMFAGGKFIDLEMVMRRLEVLIGVMDDPVDARACMWNLMQDGGLVFYRMDWGKAIVDGNPTPLWEESDPPEWLHKYVSPDG
jgi:hypothetical protein